METNTIQKRLISILMQKFGFDSINYTTIRQLSEKLRPEYKVSENTIARMAGLRTDGRKHYHQTLDMVAQAAGFLSYKKFEWISQSVGETRLNGHAHPHTSFFTLYAGIAAKENETRYLEHLVHYIHEKGISAPEYFELGEQILQGIRQNQRPEKMIKCLVENPLLSDLFLKWWVDMDYFDQYYGKAMQDLSKKQKIQNQDYFFSQTLAFEYEWNQDLQNQSKKRAAELSEVNLRQIIELTEAHAIYPVARWMKVVLIYYHHVGEKNKFIDLLDFSISLAGSLQADESMIILSQLSELGSRLPMPHRKAIETLFIQHRGSVKTEFDSLAHTGLNLQTIAPKNNLMSAKEVMHIMNTHPRQVFCSKDRILHKVRKIKE